MRLSGDQIRPSRDDIKSSIHQIRSAGHQIGRRSDQIFKRRYQIFHAIQSRLRVTHNLSAPPPTRPSDRPTVDGGWAGAAAAVCLDGWVMGGLHRGESV